MIEEERIRQGYEYMTAAEKDDFNITNPSIEHSRPEWHSDDYWKTTWKQKDVCVIITQRFTKVAVQMCLESLFRFYPDIPVYACDDDSGGDDSAQYLQYKELVTSNLTVWMRTALNSAGRHGHGKILDELIEKFVTTKYCLMLDSDVVIERGGFIEEMISEFEKDDNLYAIGTMHYASYINNGGEPFGSKNGEKIDDAIPYPHPQTSMIRIDKYRELNEPFLEDGAPLILNMKKAFDKKMRVAYYPTDKYVTHRGGTSYINPKPVWSDDHNVYLRPFVTFIISPSQNFTTDSIDSDFDIVIAKNHAREEVILHGKESQIVDNDIYNLRFQCNGEYVCDARSNYIQIEQTFMIRLKNEVIRQKAPDELTVDGLKFIKRNVWQKNQSLW